MAGDDAQAAEDTTQQVSIEVIPNGPLMIPGPITLQGADGEVTVDRPKVFLCRCGHSKNKPFCDGAHAKLDLKARSGYLRQG